MFVNCPPGPFLMTADDFVARKGRPFPNNSPSPDRKRSSPSGVNRGRLALPVCTKDGTVIAYCGRALNDETQPALIFPNGVTPSEHIFGADRVRTASLYWCAIRSTC